MAARIIKKVLPINNPYDKRKVYVVDGIYQFFKKKKLKRGLKSFTSTGRKNKSHR